MADTTDYPRVIIEIVAERWTIARFRVLGRVGERKVRTPQGSAPGNARSGQLEGQWHRKYTARLRASRVVG